MKKPILVLDFDGVIHSYTSGWKGATVIPDPPVPGVFAFICEATTHFRICVYSSRSGQVGGIGAMKKYIYENFLEWASNAPHLHYVVAEIDYPTEKPSAMVTIDDRAITFDGTWPNVEDLRNFQPWNKRPPRLPALYGIEELKHRLDSSLDAYLSEMKEGYDGHDDSIFGFNEAWDVVRKFFEKAQLVSKRTYYDDVGDFHRRFYLPHSGDGRAPGILAPDVLEFRLKFLREEVQEFEDSHHEGNLADAADALADLIYVACGTAHLMGVPLDDVWKEVQRANMTKVRASGAGDPRSKKSHSLDVVKPADFVPPNHRPALERAARDARIGAP